MLSRSTATRSALRTVGRRAFSTKEVAGIKVLSRDDGRPTSSVSVVVNAGSKYNNSTPGLAHILEKFAFANTSNRSALRLTRESELLGGQLSTSLSRDNLVLTAKFLREDLPFFVAALGDVISNTSFNKYELVENVAPIAFRESNQAAKDAVYVSTEAAYEAAFRTGLGNPLLVEAYSPVSIEQVTNFAKEAYSKANISVVGSGVVGEDLAALVGEHFADLRAGTPLVAPATKTFSGEVRVKSAGPSALTIAFPSTTSSPALAVLANVLGGPSSVKWSPGSTLLGAVASKTGTSIKTTYTPHSDASLFSVTISGASPAAIADAASATANEIKGLASTLDLDLVQKAVAATRFAAAEAAERSILAQSTDVSSVSVDAIAETVSTLAKGSVAIGAVGQVHALPYASDLF